MKNPPGLVYKCPKCDSTRVSDDPCVFVYDVKKEQAYYKNFLIET